MSVPEVFGRVDQFGPEWDVVFHGGGMQSRREWFAATEEAAMPAGARPHYVALRDGARPLAILPMQVSTDGRLGSMTSPYTVLFQPLLAPGADSRRGGLLFGRHLRRWPACVVEAIDPAWPGLTPLLAGMRRAGLAAMPYDHFGNWHEPVAGIGFDAYLATRAGALREVVRRKGRLAAKDGSIRFQVVVDEAGLADALTAYEHVYARSWKEPEPYPSFTPALLRRAAVAGTMRLGVMWEGGVPIAAQYWTLAGGVATVLKLAHDEASRRLSPGTLLTAHMVRHLLDEDGADELDFGRGDDAYKRQWAGLRRQRIGLVLANPLRWGGMMALGRHWLSRARRSVMRSAGPHPEGDIRNGGSHL